jgi:hypothetical protein
MALDSPTQARKYLNRQESIKDNDYHIPKKKASLCNRCLLHPGSKFKMNWDLLIIIFSLWNSLLIPYEFAFINDGQLDNVFFEISDRLIDCFFFIDIIITFRTVVVNTNTNELIRDWKMIALKYTLGRLWIDLLASLPIEAVTLIYQGQGVKLLGMVKMIRLLRLGRMLTYIKAHKNLKFSMKIG